MLGRSSGFVTHVKGVAPSSGATLGLSGAIAPPPYELAPPPVGSDHELVWASWALNQYIFTRARPHLGLR